MSKLRAILWFVIYLAYHCLAAYVMVKHGEPYIAIAWMSLFVIQCFLR